MKKVEKNIFNEKAKSRYLSNLLELINLDNTLQHLNI